MIESQTDLLAIFVGFMLVIHVVTWLVLIAAWDEVKMLKRRVKSLEQGAMTLVAGNPYPHSHAVQFNRITEFPES